MSKVLFAAVVGCALILLAFVALKAQAGVGDRIAAASAVLRESPDRSIVEFSDGSLWLLVQRQPDWWDGRTYFLAGLGRKIYVGRTIASGRNIVAVYQPANANYQFAQTTFLTQ